MKSHKIFFRACLQNLIAKPRRGAGRARPAQKKAKKTKNAKITTLGSGRRPLLLIRPNPQGIGLLRNDSLRPLPWRLPPGRVTPLPGGVTYTELAPLACVCFFLFFSFSSLSFSPLPSFFPLFLFLFSFFLLFSLSFSFFLLLPPLLLPSSSLFPLGFRV